MRLSHDIGHYPPFLCRCHIAATDVKTRQLRSTGLSVKLLGRFSQEASELNVNDCSTIGKYKVQRETARRQEVD